MLYQTVGIIFTLCLITLSILSLVGSIVIAHRDKYREHGAEVVVGLCLFVLLGILSMAVASCL